MSSTLFLVGSVALFLLLAMRRLHTHGRLLFAGAMILGAISGTIQGEVASGNLDVRVPLGLGLLTGIVTTAGRPYLLAPPEWRTDAENQHQSDVDDPGLSRRRWVFVGCATLVVVVWAAFSDAEPYG